MKPTVFLRIAAVLTLIHATLHTVGGVFGPPAPGVAAATVVVMKENMFPAFGNPRSYWMFYRGMGLAVAIFLFFEAIVFWQLGALARTEAQRLRPILAVFLLAYVAMAVNSYLYFFSPPVIVELLIAACFAGAIVSGKPLSVPAEVARTRG